MEALTKIASTPYTPGQTMAMSNDELMQIVRRGPPDLSNPPKQEDYEGRALHAEAVAEQMKRVNGSNALHDPSRRPPQMQQGEPNKPVGQITRGPDPIRPLASHTDAELQEIAAKAPASLSNPVSVADNMAMQQGKDARAELMRRAVSPVSGVRVR